MEEIIRWVAKGWMETMYGETVSDTVLPNLSGSVYLEELVRDLSKELREKLIDADLKTDYPSSCCYCGRVASSQYEHSPIVRDP